MQMYKSWSSKDWGTEGSSKIPEETLPFENLSFKFRYRRVCLVVKAATLRLCGCSTPDRGRISRVVQLVAR
eukprot:920662-Rhodomonas_salina.2